MNKRYNNFILRTIKKNKSGIYNILKNEMTDVINMKEKSEGPFNKEIINKYYEKYLNLVK